MMRYGDCEKTNSSPNRLYAHHTRGLGTRGLGTRGLAGTTALVALLSTCLLTGTARGQGSLIWSDEFDGTAVDTGKWEFMIGDGCSYGVCNWGNNEHQYYTSRSQNVYVQDGFLHIVARREDYGGKNYTSGRLRTLNKAEFLYGRIETRMKIPSGQGIWPAFWMLPTNSPYGGWAASGEIDIMESVNTATSIYGTIHYGDNWPDNAHSGGQTSAPGVDFGDGFHVYAIQWAPDSIRWYVDGNLYHTETSASWYSTASAASGNPRAPFDTPFHLLMNVAVGGDWPGDPGPAGIFPLEMVVDWVRAYDTTAQQTPYGGSAQVIPGTVEAEYYDEGGQALSYNDCDTSNNGGDFRTGEGVDIENCSEGGYDIGWMCEGEWLEYTVDVQQDGLYFVDLRVASDATGGTCHLAFDGIDYTGPISIPVTGGWQNWQTVRAIVQLSVGEHVMRFANDSTNDEYNLNALAFTPVAEMDINADGTIDLADWNAFTTCMTGPSLSGLPQGCEWPYFVQADLDGDGRMDLRDVECFQRVFPQFVE